ncbi:hypothetical protein ANCDUO_22862 [Ancylostoma duodenale]|uniref:Uncharacterized protein n=1 Tax=Ancylostoma duodenale TaxID=51022 RepID=A0A0C2CB42_9BILA|nr:hypothetical protein ANCDUO_22862 [Ancylostoma duodenale]
MMADNAAARHRTHQRTGLNLQQGPENISIFLCKSLASKDTVVDNNDEEYDRLVQHPRDCAKSADDSRSTKERLSYETLELIRQCEAVRATSNHHQLSSSQNGAEKR